MEKNLENGFYVPFGYVTIATEEYRDMIERVAAAEALNNRYKDEIDKLKLDIYYLREQIKQQAAKEEEEI